MSESRALKSESFFTELQKYCHTMESIENSILKRDNFSKWLKAKSPSNLEEFSEYTKEEKVDFARALFREINKLDIQIQSQKIQDDKLKVIAQTQGLLKSLWPEIDKAETITNTKGFFRSVYYVVESFNDSYSPMDFMPEYQKPTRFVKKLESESKDEKKDNKSTQISETTQTTSSNTKNFRR